MATARWTLGLLVTGSLCSCSLLFTPADTASSDAAPPVEVDASPAPAECSPQTVAEDCDPEAQCHCGQCAFVNPSCQSGLGYGAGTSPGGACVAAAMRLDTYYQHTCLLRSDGTAWCWGWNCDGQLGDHASDATGAGADCNAYSAVPVQVLQSEGGPPLDDIVDLQTGIFSTCALRSDGSVWCWGGNTSGQLGSGDDSTVLPFSLTPRQVVSSPGVPLENVEFIGSGGASVCATDSDRVMRCWGSNDKGQLQLGEGDFADRNVATRVNGAGPWRFVDGGGKHMCASRNGDIGADELWCWGRDVFGAVGNGAADNPPLADAVDCNGATDHPCFPTAQQVRDEDGPLTNPSVIGLGNTFSCAASGAPSSLWCWGENDEHALGDESDLENPVFGDTRFIATSVALDIGQSTVQDVVGGTSFACARISDALHCWGSDSNGQQGNGTGSTVWQSPSSTPLLSDIRDVAAGFSHACAILADRSVQCWGDNGAGQLGVGDDSNRDAPTALLPDYICP